MWKRKMIVIWSCSTYICASAFPADFSLCTFVKMHPTLINLSPWVWTLWLCCTTSNVVIKILQTRKETIQNKVVNYPLVTNGWSRKLQTFCNYPLLRKLLGCHNVSLWLRCQFVNVILLAYKWELCIFSKICFLPLTLFHCPLQNRRMNRSSRTTSPWTMTLGCIGWSSLLYCISL